MGPCMLTLLSSSTWPSAYKLGAHEAVRSDGRRHRPAAAYSAVHGELSLPTTATFCERRRPASHPRTAVRRGGWHTAGSPAVGAEQAILRPGPAGTSVRSGWARRLHGCCLVLASGQGASS